MHDGYFLSVARIQCEIIEYLMKVPFQGYCMKHKILS